MTLSQASFSIDTSVSPATIARAGRLSELVPDGQHLWLFSYPRPDSFDSTPDRNPGNGRMYPIGEILTNDGCWSLPPRELGYAEALGITYDQHVVLVDEAASQEFADELARQERDGFSPEELRLRSPNTIATFQIPTTS
ncbi:hypothetical protein [Pseudonocardia broussonetiae]|uniref:Uncharacterized protein n=1 Tax=Pseudonocardia broussonetiae TaxID=2736640 RepID=A0A6M6JDK2_9PSEU|nr:hypothetical protein [Pseudonocardia broussonetiae]QJY45150.1 hypothetical protein HOP40_04340 [Pseudonocardia broussonetiae]